MTIFDRLILLLLWRSWCLNLLIFCGVQKMLFWHLMLINYFHFFRRIQYCLHKVDIISNFYMFGNIRRFFFQLPNSKIARISRPLTKRVRLCLLLSNTNLSIVIRTTNICIANIKKHLYSHLVHSLRSLCICIYRINNNLKLQNTNINKELIN